MKDYLNNKQSLADLPDSMIDQSAPTLKQEIKMTKLQRLKNHYQKSVDSYDDQISRIMILIRNNPKDTGMVEMLSHDKKIADIKRQLMFQFLKDLEDLD